MGHVLKESARASNTPAYAILVEGFNDLVQEGLTDEKVRNWLLPDDKVIYAVDDKDGEFLGAVSYRVDPTNESAQIMSAYVEPSSRQRGIFKDMLHVLSVNLKGSGVKHLTLHVWVANKIGHVVAQKCGFTAGWVEYHLGV